jgi:hypothetical protein
MSRKDYVLLAEVLRVNLNRAKLSADKSAQNALYTLTDDLMVELQRDNPRFQSKRFLNAVVYGRQPSCWRDECRGLGQGLEPEELNQ